MRNIFIIPLFILAALLFCGVSAQPVLVKEIPAGSYGFFGAQGNLYFFNDHNLWRSDGTAAGTLLVKDVVNKAVTYYTGNRFEKEESFVTSTGFYFITTDGVTYTLWRSNGTAAGTVTVASYDNIKPLGILNNEFYYGAMTGLSSRLYKVGAGAPVLLTTINLAPYPSYFGTWTALNPADHTVVDGVVFFKGNSGAGNELWKTNGTVAGTVEVKEFLTTTSLSDLTNVSGTLFFSTSETGSYKLWKSNGTNAGTVLVRTFDSDVSEGIGNFLAYHAMLFFTESFPVSQTLYVSDGTEAGTHIIKTTLGTDTFISDLGVTNDQIYFRAETQGFPEFLYRSDGTAAGTVPVRQLNAHDTRDLTPAGNHLFYADHDGPTTMGDANDADDAYQLWQSDLSAINTDAVRDLFPGTDFPDSDNLTNVNEVLYFTSLQSGHLYLYKYNPNGPSGAVAYFTVVDADTDMDKMWLRDNDTIVKYPGDLINIRFTPVGASESVVFVLNGSTYSTENQPPYALAGDESGDYAAWLPAAQGNYTLAARVYASNLGTGTLLSTSTVHFYIKVLTLPAPPVVNAGTDKFINLPVTSVTLTGTASDPDGSIVSRQWYQVSGPATATIASPTALSTIVSGLTVVGVYRFRLTVTDNSGLSSADEVLVTVGPAGQAVVSFTLVNADTDADIMTLTNGMVLNQATLPTTHLNIRANTSPWVVGSVRFVYDALTPVENTAPYALFGDASGNYTAGSITAGSHSLSARPYTGANATGTAGTALSISFTMINSAPRLSASDPGFSIRTNCFPNPSSGYFAISVTSPLRATGSVEVLDESGRVAEQLFQGDVLEGQELQLKWNASGYKPGIYLMRVKLGDYEKTERLILQ